MPQFQRSQVSTLIERLLESPDQMIVISGPRQTGKTTATRQALRTAYENHRIEHAYIPVDEPDFQDIHDLSAVESDPVSLYGSDASDPATQPLGLSVSGSVAVPFPPVARDSRWLVDIWEKSRQQAWRSEHGFALVLDEIQKVKGWSEVVKGLWDADRRRGCPMRVVILGSAPLLMQDGLTESLAGRFEPIHVRHWSYPEMSQAFGFSLKQYIYFGGYPGSASRVAEALRTGDSERWATYIREVLLEPTLERDVLSMTRIRKPALLRRLFEVGASKSGQIVSHNKMLGPLQDAGNTETLERYLNLLSQVGLLVGLPKHMKRPISAKASTPKLNVLNTALMAMLSGYTFEEAQADRKFWGHMVESAVGAHLYNTASTITTVKYWRDDKEHVEVDFVLHRGPNTVGIEVKSGRLRSFSATKGLEEFRRRFDAAATIVVGEMRVSPGGETIGVPLEDFLSRPADHWFNIADTP